MRSLLRLITSAAVLAAGLGWSISASAVERQQVVNGTLYSVVAPTVANTSVGGGSYIRLFNGNQASATTFTILVVGTCSGTTYGTASIAVPSEASPQFPLSMILTLANTSISAMTACDTANGIGPALYISNGDATASHEHVTWNSATNHFADVSNCKTLINEAFIGAGHTALVLPNVHTTTLSAYPSQIVIHNFWNAAVTYRLTVYDAGTADNNTGAIRADSGTKMGTKDYTINANSSLTLSMSALEAALSPAWSPTSNQFHANVVISDTINGGTPNAVISQAIITPAGDQIDMSNACAVNAVTSSSGGGGITPPPVY